VLEQLRRHEPADAGRLVEQGVDAVAGRQIVPPDDGKLAVRRDGIEAVGLQLSLRQAQ